LISRTTGGKINYNCINWMQRMCGLPYDSQPKEKHNLWSLQKLKNLPIYLDKSKITVHIVQPKNDEEQMIALRRALRHIQEYKGKCYKPSKSENSCCRVKRKGGEEKSAKFLFSIHN